MKLEAYYQQEAHNRLFSIPLDDKDSLIGEISRMKGARAFMEYVGRMKLKSEKVIEEDASE